MSSRLGPATSGSARLLSNRGANGIDGTVSSAFGVAAATGLPVVLLIGDVALLHDIGGLLAARRLELAITIVLLNNDGGGIFHFLPVATQTDAFEDHVATPHGVDFRRAADLYEIEYVLPRRPRRAPRAPSSAASRRPARRWSRFAPTAIRTSRCTGGSRMRSGTA